MVIKCVTAIFDLLLLTMLMSFVIDVRNRRMFPRSRWMIIAVVAWVFLVCAVLLKNDWLYMAVMTCYVCISIWSLTTVQRLRTVLETMLLTLIAGFPLNTLVFVLNVLGISLVDGDRDAVLSACTALADFMVIFWVYRQRKKYDDEMAIRFTVFEYTAAVLLFLLTTLLGVVMNPLHGELSPEVLASGSGDFLVTMLTALVVFNNIFFLVMVWRSKTTAYYQHLNAMNAQYVENELQYFESYKQAQEDIRRFRHDMKHHMSRMAQLCEAQDTETLAAYIDNYQKEWMTAAHQLFRTGNDHVDAILNGRAAHFRKAQIDVSVQGSFIEPLQLSPFDTCAIFANAVDNAIEENERLADSEARWFRFTIRKNRRYYMISMENPLARVGEQAVRTSKDDPRNHGFGLYSIREKTEKNGGTVQIERGDGRFVLNVFLPF